MKPYIAGMVLVLLVSLVSPVTAAPDKGSLALLASYMQGDFNSSKQAKSTKGYFDISLGMTRIWAKKPGVWLYVEQAVSKKRARPYRQRVYHLQRVKKNLFSSTIYKITIARQLRGQWNNRKALQQLRPVHLRLLKGCTIFLAYKNGVFKGSTKKNECLNKWGKATYATSIVTVTSKLMVSWDRGWNKQGKQVWGARKGGYRFVKVR